MINRLIQGDTSRPGLEVVGDVYLRLVTLESEIVISSGVISKSVISKSV